jgi:hypothetical protein
MILLRPDCLVFKRADGQNVPCSAHEVILQLLGDSAQGMEEDFLQNVAEAVLHYFKEDLGWTTVSVGEFAQALSKVLKSFGWNCPMNLPQEPASLVLDSDLANLANESGTGLELLFFPRLRAELKGKLTDAPRVVRFLGLRRCVKQLTGAKRWTPRCQDLNDRIVEYLRECLSTEEGSGGCALVVI